MADLRSARKVFLAIAVVTCGAILIYNLSTNVQVRINDTINSEIQAEETDAVRTRGTQEAQVFEANATTFAMVTNAYVAWKAFLDSPVIGHGLGTHSASYQEYASDIVSPNFFMWGLNRDDANSMFLRLMSELGAVGLAGWVVLVIYFGRVRGAAYVIMRNAIIPYLIMRTIRLGSYFTLENFFFAMLYAFNYLQYRADISAQAPDRK